jgi:hypothetical protein
MTDSDFNPADVEGLPLFEPYPMRGLVQLALFVRGLHRECLAGPPMPSPKRPDLCSSRHQMAGAKVVSTSASTTELTISMSR